MKVLSGSDTFTWGPELTVLVSASHLLITINCSSNFAIYCVKDKKFRKYFLRILRIEDLTKKFRRSVVAIMSTKPVQTDYDNNMESFV